jgi:hypothetical protein
VAVDLFDAKEKQVAVAQVNYILLADPSPPGTPGV